MAASWPPGSRTGAARGTALGPAPAPGTAAGWYPVARSADVGSTPLAVGADGRAFVVVRLRPGAEVTALPARCPHRLVPLATATVVDGRVRCGYHGWEFNAEGRCVSIPSAGPHAAPPPRADLAGPWAVEERDGWVWLAPERTALPRPPRLGGALPTPEPVPALPEPAGPVLGNLDPALEHAWHPVALSGELLDGGYVQTRLLGRNWTVHRHGGALDADPPAWGVTERDGVVWLAPAEPHDEPLPVPEAAEPGIAAHWLLPGRTSAPAGTVADALLDLAHRPLLPGTGRGDVPLLRVTPQPGGFTATVDLPAAPVTGGERLAGRWGRATAVHRVPFQLRWRLEDPGSGAARTVVVLLQPEDADSTRVYTCLLLHAAGTAGVPAGVVAAEAAAQQEDLTAELALLARLGRTGLPLLARDELHVPADRAGTALRRALADFVAGCAAADRAAALQQRASA